MKDSYVNTKIQEVDYHRNGVGGAGFFVALFTDKKEPGRQFIGISFDSTDPECRNPEFVAVLDLNEAVKGNIYMHPHEQHEGGNAWRGADHYGPTMQEAAAILDARYEERLEAYARERRERENSGT